MGSDGQGYASIQSPALAQHLGAGQQERGASLKPLRSPQAFSENLLYVKQ